METVWKYFLHWRNGALCSLALRTREPSNRLGPGREIERESGETEREREIQMCECHRIQYVRVAYKNIGVIGT